MRQFRLGMRRSTLHMFRFVAGVGRPFSLHEIPIVVWLYLSTVYLASIVND
jgi:hypothetical protein